ncbi:hypothetical protein [Spirillospora sp. CA-294931]|uniref:hypothetical protein n=1 Tax=Spirillospora sp. CA-294931 TaxID=3240042 RepID=UPI003D933F83
MDDSTSKPGAVVAGFVVGGVGGFVLTEGGAAFFHFVLGLTPDVEKYPALIAVFLGVPIVTAVVGAFAGLRIAERVRRPH